MAFIQGTAGGVNDVLIGTKAADVVTGFSGDDLLIGGQGNDTLIGGSGSDVMWGGVDNDNFVFSAGHIINNDKDYVADFELGVDTLSFLDSGGGQKLVVDSVSRGYLSETSFNGHDLRNSAVAQDITFTVRNSETGQSMEIVLLDAWSGNRSDAWDAYLSTLGVSFS